MPEQDDLIVAFHALQMGSVTRDQLLDALYAMLEDRTTGLPVRALGTVLVQKRFLSQAQLREIITTNAVPGMIPEEASRSDSIKLGQLLAMSGVVTYGQVMEALLQQEVSKEQGQPRMRLGEYLVSMGYTTPQAIHRALSYQRKAVYGCRKCGAHFNIVNAQPNQLYSCIRCHGALAAETDSVRVEESAVVEALTETPGPPSQTPLPQDADGVPVDRLRQERAMTRELRETWKVPEASIALASHWQMEIAQFGIHAPLLDVLRRLRALGLDAVQKLKSTDFGAGLRRLPAIPGYRITGRVASGSRAELLTVQPQFTPAPAGLKLLHPDLSKDAAHVARFRQDASLLARFDHPCLLKAHEYGTLPTDSDGGALHYVTTEFVRGTSLSQLIAVKGKLPASRAVGITLDVAQAMRHLEREGFSHGELVPENVLIDERSRGRVIDAGGAQPVKPGPPDPRIAEDVYALGVLLRMMLTGRMSAERPMDLGSASVSASLLSVMRSMLNPDATKRFQRFADLVAVLQATTNA